jgi:hypothetical protein
MMSERIQRPGITMISVLTGSQGDRSRDEWLIAVYTNESLAKADLVRAENLHRVLFGSLSNQCYINEEKSEMLWATTEGRELEAIMGERCDENKELALYCWNVEYRDAQAIVARNAATLGVVGNADAPQEV